MRKQVENVTDARARVAKGKIPRRIVIVAGGIAAALIGTLAFYYQSRSETQAKEEIEEQRAEKLKTRASAADASQNLGQTIRAQQRAAREEAARQEASAVGAEPAGRTPVLSAKDFRPGPQGTEAVAQKNTEDTLLAAPLFKTGLNKFKDNQRPKVDLQNVPDPSQMRAMQQAAAAAGAVTPPAATEGAPLSSDRQFLKETAAAKPERTGIAGRLPACTVTQGFVIPATFVGGNNSDKPGEFRAMVSQDVYDTVDGTCKAIPAGAMLVGTYSSDISIGQERLLVAFTRLQLPNKKWVPLGSMQGADPNGYAGVSGDVNNHFFKILWGAVAIAVLEQRFNNQQTATTASAGGGLTTYGNAAGQVATQTAQTILNRNQNIRPTITTEPGQKLLVQVKQDIVMEPYRD
ncbi:TrbI/VirB10 family protein [Ralstonia nicotianae]|uniref:TrbI/VirB10 family protein n=1 Tax=Ralstonia pseudosolanacearum TaxID=1310165 RepID=UPI0020059BDE|nr:TrbI/VirB10 family protein [Ralstonia pseudosolanacearum]MCK4118403.1 TrbI/VirB10 family protein [Ralstonia pseudosolanacearum]